MSQNYDIFFAAQLVDGFDEETVRENLAKLFKANEETLNKLFSGKPQMIKRGVDKQAAIKYKMALQKAGAIALVRANAPAPESTTPANETADKAKPAASEAATNKPVIPTSESPVEESSVEESPAEAEKDAAGGSSMADRIAALANAPAPAAAAVYDESLSLAPAGSDVLREDERTVFEELDIDTSFIHVDMEYAGEGNPGAEPPPPAPDTSHLSMGEVGEKIPQLESDVVPLNPDVSHLSMGPVGEEIPHLFVVLEPVNPDISNINLAPEGSDVLEEQYRVHDDTAAPNTDHISLETAS